MRLVALIFGVCLALCPVRADAAPIGSFSWVHDILFGTGSTFTVVNDSGDPFTSVLIDLYAPDAATPFYTVNLGDIGAGESAQSIDDFSLFTLPADLDRTDLRLTYLADPVTAQLLATELIGDPLDLLTGTIDITVPDPPAPTVPEPGTLLSLALGLGAVRGRTLLIARQRKSPASTR